MADGVEVDIECLDLKAHLGENLGHDLLSDQLLAERRLCPDQTAKTRESQAAAARDRRP
jgi:hypothetical protein